MRALFLALALLGTAFSPATAAPDVVTRTRTPSGPAPAVAADFQTAPAAGARNDVVRILAQFGSTTRLCSGVMVMPRVAITAGRCVHQGAGGDFALDYWVQPGSDGASAPFGQAFGTLLIAFTDWTERSDPDYDVGFVVLDRPLGEQSGYVSPARTDGCGTYGRSDLSWIGYASTSGGQVAESGAAGCTTGTLAVPTATTFSAGTPLFASDGRVHAVSSTRSNGLVTFTRLNSRVLTYYTDSLLNSLDPCDLRVEAGQIEFGAGSGEALVSVSTGPGCAWQVDGAPPSWIEVLSGSGFSFGRPIFRVSANTGAARSATLMLEGKALAISQAAAGPAGNARFATASTVGAGIVSTTIDTTGAGVDTEAPKPAGVSGSAGAWWRWTAPTTTFATATATSDHFSPALGVYTGSRPGALTPVAEGRETVSFTGVAGTTYMIFVTGAGEGPVRLQIEQLFPGAEAQTGWWWNPDEPGRGIFIETNGFASFVGWFGYDGAGNWLWHAGRGEILTRRYMQGIFSTFRDGQVLGGPYRAPTYVGSGGTMLLTQTTATTATLSSGTFRVPLERFSFAAGGAHADRASFVPETGWWWVPDEPGTGYGIEVQGNQLMVGAFHYDADGTPRWSVAMGPMTDARIFEGTLTSYRGGQALGQSYHAPSSTVETGHITLLFSDATHAVALLPGGRQVVLERYQF